VGTVIGIIVAVVVVVLLAVFVIAGYNGLVRARNAYKNAFAQIDVQLRRRFDLIPNLIETAKAYMAHEPQTLEAVVAARNNAMNGLSAVRGKKEAIDKALAVAKEREMVTVQYVGRAHIYRLAPQAVDPMYMGEQPGDNAAANTPPGLAQVLEMHPLRDEGPTT
jgi:hypothetical protein